MNVFIEVSILRMQPCLVAWVGTPAILGSFVALERRGGSEDPWLCISGFRPTCLYRGMDFPKRKTDVSSGIYLIWTWSQFSPEEKRMAALTYTGRSDALRRADLTMSLRSDPPVFRECSNVCDHAHTRESKSIKHVNFDLS